MSKPSIIARGALAAAAGAVALAAALAAPQVAAAQSYGYEAPPTYSEVCRSDQTNRTGLGALLGAGLGAVLGSQIAANHHRSDGALVGGLAGAVGGGVVGHNTTPCANQAYAPAPPPPPVTYASPPAAYVSPPPPPPAPRAYYERPQEDYDDAHWAYGAQGERFRIAERPPAPDGCTLAESPIYMPDGRVQKRFVRVCPDASGRYQVVD
jgi:hypothetical protein